MQDATTHLNDVHQKLGEIETQLRSCMKQCSEERESKIEEIAVNSNDKLEDLKELAGLRDIVGQLKAECKQHQATIDQEREPGKENDERYAHLFAQRETHRKYMEKTHFEKLQTEYTRIKIELEDLEACHQQELKDHSITKDVFTRLKTEHQEQSEEFEKLQSEHQAKSKDLGDILKSKSDSAKQNLAQATDMTKLQIAG